ncbi:MAG: M48 family metalloprotease [Pseudomonadota bacterium]|nr:M48 family metalloprotease [Pseudomonadota bacterium]
MRSNRLKIVCQFFVFTCLLISLSYTFAQNEFNDLPDMGSPADALLSRNLESQIGRQIFNGLVATGAVMQDPELQEYIQDIGMQLVGNSNSIDQRFQFFFVNDNIINAFALPGGFIGVHSGLLLATKTESQLAGVLAHEISHVTQRHISRAVLANQRASTLSLAAMLGAILVGVATGVDPGMIQGAVGAAQSFTIEQQIKFTRSNEYEADRIGISVLANSGFDPFGMPEFFETIGRLTGSLEFQAPEFLRTHPVSAARMAETRSRAKKFKTSEVTDSIGYSLARARARIQTSSRNETALDYFKAEENKANASNLLEFKYGRALILAELGNYDAAEVLLKDLLIQHEEAVPLYTDLARIQGLQGNNELAIATYEKAMKLFPRNVPLTVRYAETLLLYSESEQAHKILLDLLNHVPPTLEQVRLIALAANAAGKIGDAHYYMAEYHVMNGSLKLAIDQLQLALGIPSLNNVQRARFLARLNQFQEFFDLQEKQKRERSRQ